MKNVKYTTDGKKVVIINDLNQTEKIVQEIFVNEKGEEIQQGEMFIVKNLLDEPMKSWKENQLKQLELTYEKDKTELDNKIKNTNTEKMSTSNLIISKLIDKILQLDNSITTAELIHIVCVDAYDRKQKHLAKNKILEVIQLSNNSKQIALNDEKKKVVIDVLKDLNILED